ncbi:WD40-repeat-containing domain protein [Choanephora cucurbitarum]|nr:WD40-repeat-containing domain protein [Choanephora cucurbitarum]
MTLLTPSLITPNTSKLLSYLSFNKSCVAPATKSPDVPTHITIVMRKDGTPTTRYLNTYQDTPSRSKLLGRRRALSSQCLSSPPKQRRLISSFIPRFHVSSRRSSLSHFQLRDSVVIDSPTMIYRLQKLPIELILHMLMYLDYKSLLKLSQTCKQLHQLCQNRYLWQRLFQTDHLLHRIQLTYDYRSLYKNHHQLHQRWRKGQVRTRYLTGHEDSVYCLVWLGPDRIVSGSRDRSIKVWDLIQTHSSSLVLTKTHHEGSVLCLRVADNHRFMVSGSSDATCLIWSLPQLEPQARLTGHTGGVLDVCIVNECIVSSSRDSSIRVWSQLGQELKRLVGHGGPVNALGSHGSLVVSASGDTTLRLWDIETGHCLRTFIGHTKGLACVRFDGNLIYSGGQDNKLKVWDVHSGKNLATFTGHTDLIRTIDSFGNMVVSGSYDKTLKVWDIKENKCILSFQSGHSSWIFNTLLSRTKIISAGQDKRIMILDFGYDLVTLDD